MASKRVSSICESRMSNGPISQVFAGLFKMRGQNNEFAYFNVIARTHNCGCPHSESDSFKNQLTLFRLFLINLILIFS